MTDVLEAAQNGEPTEVVNEEANTDQEVSPSEESAEEAVDGSAGTTEDEASEEATPEVAPEHTVPLHHLLNERQQKQELKSELDALRAQLQEIQEKLKPTVPDFDEDPKAHLDARMKQVEETVTKADKPLTKAEIQEQFKQQMVMQELNKDHQQMLETQPDYMNALNHAREHFRHQHLMSGVDPSQIDGIIGQAEMNMAQQVLSEGGSPGKAIYEYAVNSLGYKGKAPKQTKAQRKAETMKKGEEHSSPTPGGDGGGAEAPAGNDAFDEAFSSAFDYSK